MPHVGIIDGSVVLSLCKMAVHCLFSNDIFKIKIWFYLGFVFLPCEYSN